MKYHFPGETDTDGIIVHAGTPKYFGLSNNGAGSITVKAEAGCSALVSIDGNDGVTTAPVTVSGGTTVTFPSVPLPFPAFPPLVRTGVKVEVLTGGFVTVNP